MNNRIKNAIYSLVLLVAIVVVYFIRKDDNKPELLAFTGNTMGPIAYNVKYFDKEKRNFKPAVDSILVGFNNSLSTYIPGSEISTFNKDSVYKFSTSYFYDALQITKEISNLTGGAFNPTIMPLVNLWGFGPDKITRPDSSQVDSLKTFIDYNLIQFDSIKVWKLNKAVSLDFSASAKGQGVDVVAEFLESKGIAHYFVEIGGEVRTGGVNLEKGREWVVGILHPESEENAPFFYATLPLKDKAMATSGNYFNYRVIDGLKYSHTLSPVTGFPIVHPLLSATIIAEECQAADAMATAFMVMGHEKAIELLENNKQFEALLIYTTPEGELKHYATDGININLEKRR